MKNYLGGTQSTFVDTKNFFMSFRTRKMASTSQKCTLMCTKKSK